MKTFEEMENALYELMRQVTTATLAQPAERNNIMAKKQIFMAERLAHPRWFKVWTDLTTDEIEQTEGVTSASRIAPGGTITITLDPRYDADEVMEELERLAHEKARRQGSGSRLGTRRPSSTEMREIREMAPGERGYTVSWAVEEERLNLNHYASSEQSGTHKMPVKRLSSGKFAVQGHYYCPHCGMEFRQWYRI